VPAPSQFRNTVPCSNLNLPADLFLVCHTSERSSAQARRAPLLIIFVASSFILLDRGVVGGPHLPRAGRRPRCRKNRFSATTCGGPQRPSKAEVVLYVVALMRTVSFAPNLSRLRDAASYPITGPDHQARPTTVDKSKSA
jgi:hypothetical protein